MSDQSDSQNREEEQVHLSEGTSPSSSSDEGSRSTPSNLPKAATRARKKRTSNSKDEDYVAEEDEATSKKVLKKEYGTAAATKPGLNRKVPAKRTPMLKVRGSTQETERSEPKEPEVTEKKAPARRIPTSKPRKVAIGETMKFTIESEDEAVGQDKKKKRVRTTSAKVLGKPSMRRDLKMKRKRLLH